MLSVVTALKAMRIRFVYYKAENDARVSVFLNNMTPPPL